MLESGSSCKKKQKQFFQFDTSINEFEKVSYPRHFLVTALVPPPISPLRTRHKIWPARYYWSKLINRNQEKVKKQKITPSMKISFSLIHLHKLIFKPVCELSLHSCGRNHVWVNLQPIRFWSWKSNHFRLGRMVGFCDQISHKTSGCNLWTSF